MSEEIKVETKEQCLCKNEFFRKFLVISLGTFTGAFCALSLFAALNKPPIPHHPYMFHKHHKMHHGITKDHDCDCECHKNHKKHHGDFKKHHKNLETKKEIDD